MIRSNFLWILTSRQLKKTEHEFSYFVVICPFVFFHNCNRFWCRSFYIYQKIIRNIFVAYVVLCHVLAHSVNLYEVLVAKFWNARVLYCKNLHMFECTNLHCKNIHALYNLFKINNILSVKLHSSTVHLLPYVSTPLLAFLFKVLQTVHLHLP